MSSTLQPSVFMGKNYSENFLIPSKIQERISQWNKMFEISEQLILEQSDEIFGVSQISWESSPWKQLPLVIDEEVSSVSCLQRFMYSQILCYALERWIRTQHELLFGNHSWNGSKIHHNTEHWSLSAMSKSSWTKWPNRTIPKVKYLHVDVSITSHGDLKTPTSFLCMQEDFRQEDVHSSDLDQKRSGYSTHDSRTQGEWNRVAELMMIEFRESGHPVFRSTSPLSRGNAKKQRRWTNIYTSVPIGHTIETVVRTIISVYQLSIYGAVSDLCEEYSIRQTSTGRPVLAGQSDPFFAPADLLIMTSTSVNSTLHTSFSHAVNTH